MPFAIGALAAIAVFSLAGLIGLGRERGFYPAVLIVIASYYVLFAVMSGSTPTLAIETACMAIFAAIAIAGFKSARWLTIAGLVAHGVFDWTHAALVANPGVPGRSGHLPGAIGSAQSIDPTPARGRRLGARRRQLM